MLFVFIDRMFEKLILVSVQYKNPCFSGAIHVPPVQISPDITQWCIPLLQECPNKEQNSKSPHTLGGSMAMKTQTHQAREISQKKQHICRWCEVLKIKIKNKSLTLNCAFVYFILWNTVKKQFLTSQRQCIILWPVRNVWLSRQNDFLQLRCQVALHWFFNDKAHVWNGFAQVKPSWWGPREHKSEGCSKNWAKIFITSVPAKQHFSLNCWSSPLI